MRGSLRKAEYLPLKFSLLVMWLTLLIYLFGPICWIQEWDAAEYITILLLVSYFTAFAIGYLVRSRYSSKNSVNYVNLANTVTWRRFLKYTIYINLAVVIANAVIYSEITSISALLSKAIKGIVSPATVYYAKNASSRSGSIIVGLILLYSPMMYITNVLSVFSFNQLSFPQKACVVATFVFEIARWLAIGTNKGLFDIVLLFVSYYIVILMLYKGREEERNRQNKKRLLRIGLIVVIAFVLFFAFFGTAISDRVGGKYNVENYTNFPYNLIPEGLRFFVDKADSYLVQGYDNLEKIIENCEFQWTFGAGNSRFLMQAIDLVLGVDLTSRTYPYQLKSYGVDPLASWHSAYAWFASDITFVGVIVLMFIAGYYMRGLVDDIILSVDPIAMTLLYFMILMITNASCTNYVLSVSNSFIGFWSLVIVRFLQKKGKRIVFRRR